MIDVNLTEFKNLLNLAVAFTNEATFVVNGDRLELLVLDATHVAMARGSIALSSKPEVDSFSVKADQLQKALSTVGETAKMEIKDGILTIKGEKSKARQSLIMPESNALKVPNFNICAHAVIQPSRLKTAFAYGSLTRADHVKIVIDDGHLIVVTGEYPNNAEIDGDEDGEGSAVAGFMLDYIQTIVDLAIKAKSNLTIGMGGDDRPAWFSWGSETAVYSVLVAPRIES